MTSEAGATRVRVLVSGRVQGVFYRGSCRLAALRQKVDGWVRNLSDGRVEAVFEGPPERVDAMVQWCRSGPVFAEVSDVEVHAEPPEGLRGFAIRSGRGSLPE